MLLSRGQPHLRRCATYRRLHGIERGDVPEGSFGDRGFGIAHELYEAATQVTPAMHQHPWSLRSFDTRQPIITLIAIALQESPAEALQESFGMFAASPRRVTENLRLDIWRHVSRGTLSVNVEGRRMKRSRDGSQEVETFLDVQPLSAFPGSEMFNPRNSLSLSETQSG